MMEQWLCVMIAMVLIGIALVGAVALYRDNVWEDEE